MDTERLVRLVDEKLACFSIELQCTLPRGSNCASCRSFKASCGSAVGSQCWPSTRLCLPISHDDITLYPEHERSGVDDNVMQLARLVFGRLFGVRTSTRPE